jgi:hypothetical protein
MRRLAVLSLHTSPLTQPGAGDSGGMNVYVRELVSSLAQAGVASDVYVRRWADGLPDVVEVEPGFRVLHVPAGPVDLPKEALPEVVDVFADGVLARLTNDVGGAGAGSSTPTTGSRPWRGTASSTSWTCRWCRRSTRWRG